MINKLITVLAIILIPFNVVFAYQSKAAADNETVKFQIAKNDYSRIFVTNDRIISIKGQNNLYEIKEFKESDDGIIFIRPLATIDSYFSVFITTELGHHFTLKLIAKKISAENIEIKPLLAIQTIASKWEQNAPYIQTIIDLLRVMVNQHSIQGFAEIDLTDSKPLSLTNGIEMKLLKIYRGNILTGEEWLLKNKSNQPISLHANQYYYVKNIRAISVAAEWLKPKEKTFLYRIISS